MCSITNLLSLIQIPEGKAGSPTTIVHRPGLLQHQWNVSVCTVVHGVGSSATILVDLW